MSLHAILDQHFAALVPADESQNIPLSHAACAFESCK
jgi:hypothetical protein